MRRIERNLLVCCDCSVILTIRDEIIKAIQNKEIISVRYARKEGGISERKMMPFDISPGARTPGAPEKFWGHCIIHDRTEQKYMAGVLAAKPTGEHFDPSMLEASFSTKPNYRIPRDW